MTNDHNIKVKGCGCRYRICSSSFNPYEECEHLCDIHKDHFILQLYNRDIELHRIMESDALAMDEMNRQLEEIKQNNNNNNS